LKKNRKIMTGKSSKINVSFFQRKARKVGNYSVEFIFKDVRSRLADLINAKEVYSQYESSGLFKRIYNCIEAACKQSEVNHITGDINYTGIFLKKKRTIQTILDCVYLSNASGMKYRMLKLFWLTIPVKRARYIIAISQSTKNEILKHVDCDPDKIIVIPVAISERYCRKDKPFNRQTPKILQVGTAPNKNITRLAEALQNIPCHLDIVGKHNNELEELLKKYKIDYSYSWNLSDEDILKKYENADIITLVSTYEGFGMPILEAQAVGRCVISSNILSMPEVAGGAACLVDPYNVEEIRDGFLKIINDADYRQKMMEKGFENVKRFDPEKIALQYFDLYKKIAGRN
jgi:glycosyltransferase involved in cell wall biosynthesis